MKKKNLVCFHVSFLLHANLIKLESMVFVVVRLLVCLIHILEIDREAMTGEMRGFSSFSFLGIEKSKYFSQKKL